jgi:hypothetical protein
MPRKKEQTEDQPVSSIGIDEEYSLMVEAADRAKVLPDQVAVNENTSFEDLTMEQLDELKAEQDTDGQERFNKALKEIKAERKAEHVEATE